MKTIFSYFTIKNIIVWGLLLAFLCGTLFGAKIRDVVIEPLMWLSVGISICAAILFYYFYFTDRNSFREKLKSAILKTKNRRKVRFVLFSPLIIPVMVFPTISIGLPTLVHMIISKPGVEHLTVESKQSLYRQKYCKGGIEVKEYNYLWNKRICGLDIDLWRKIKPGQSISVVGTVSPIGFKVSGLLLDQK